MLASFGELTPLPWGLLAMAALFVMQLLLCFRARTGVTRSLPVLLVMAGLVFSGAAYGGLVTIWTTGTIADSHLMGLACAFIVGIAAFGVALAWLVYGVMMFAVDRS